MYDGSCAAVALHLFIVEDFSEFLKQSNKHPASRQELEADAKTDDSPVITALVRGIMQSVLIQA